MTVNFDFNFWTMVLFILNFSLAILVMLGNSKKAKEEEFKNVQSRVTTLEVRMDNGIDKKDIIALHRRLDELVAAVNHMQGRLSVEHN
jgi:tetrahydromethanopterin S-methyltransferase subunit G